MNGLGLRNQMEETDPGSARTVFSTSMSHRLLGNEREAASPVCASARKGCCSSEAVAPSMAAPNP